MDKQLQLNYRTPEAVKRSFMDVLLRPMNAYFYTRAISTIMKASKYAGREDFYEYFIEYCGRVIKAVEATGTTVEVYGLENVDNRPCVYVGNHMSTLETVTLGHVLRDKGEVSFVIKESLMKYPYFKDILGALECITVTRTSPIQDLKKILREGPKLLEKGISVVVFPQHTRGAFDPSDFSSIACKLAKRAKVPIVPLALDSRFWGKGKVISDLGPISRDIPVRFAFGDELVIDKNEKEVHAQCLDFIVGKPQEWGAY
ncbi:MAG: 1-acyl-sn-glycerol-3-phosphate acyltransferase, partial [Lentisphaeraceae bacterium]|nr:1-acyl-sn-glycerol-3-phosphate acyltransferase [Lentisphaeraceae bacterium]